jgi:hypothetical protein
MSNRDQTLPGKTLITLLNKAGGAGGFRRLERRRADRLVPAPHWRRPRIQLHLPPHQARPGLVRRYSSYGWSTSCRTCLPAFPRISRTTRRLYELHIKARWSM